MVWNIQRSNCIEIPKDAACILNIFLESGYEIYLVGGCVRDSLLGREVNDWDFCTDATPEQVAHVCEIHGIRCIPTGLKHGTVKAMLNSEGYEITTYRIEGDYTDGRHPDFVEFTSSLMEDLARRDFTINALAYNWSTGIIDYFHGLRDLGEGLIRCVGDPKERFGEDSLRRLRAVRFAAQLGFQIEDNTYSELHKGNASLELLSRERLMDELVKILLSANATQGIKELYELGMMEYIMPELIRGRQDMEFVEWKKHYERVSGFLGAMESKLSLRLAALACSDFLLWKHDVFDSLSHEQECLMEQYGLMLKRLRFDNRTVGHVEKLLSIFRMYKDQMNTAMIKRMIAAIGRDKIEDAYDLMIAFCQTNPFYYDKINGMMESKGMCHHILSMGMPVDIQDLAINGRDLIESGIKDGKEIGKLLEIALDLVLRKPEYNTRRELMSYVVHEWKKNHDS